VQQHERQKKLAPDAQGRFGGSRQEIWNITDLYTVIPLRYWVPDMIFGVPLKLIYPPHYLGSLPYNIHWKAESIPTVHENMAWYAGDP
jgi:hypothetical protein